MSALYDINFIPSSSSTLIEYKKEGDVDWTTPVSPANPTSLFTYPLTLDDDTVYYVRVTSLSGTCSPASRIIYIDTSTETGTTTTTSTTSTLAPFSVSLVRTGPSASGTLSATIHGGVGPYSYVYSCIPTGPCEAHTIGTPTGSVADDATPFPTSYTITLYAGTTYQWYCTVTDSLSNAVVSPLVTNPACLVPETLITLHDGETVHLESLAEGDHLYGKHNKVTHYEVRTVDKLYIINEGLLKCSEGHVHILHSGVLIQSLELEQGYKLMQPDGGYVEIASIEVEHGSFKVIDISTTNGTYVANGILTHNKFACP